VYVDKVNVELDKVVVKVGLVGWNVMWMGGLFGSIFGGFLVLIGGVAVAIVLIGFVFGVVIVGVFGFFGVFGVGILVWKGY